MDTEVNDELWVQFLENSYNLGEGNNSSDCKCLVFNEIIRCKNLSINFSKKHIFINDDPTALYGLCLNIEHDSSLVQITAGFV